jgi:hypothetical protein
MMRKHESTDDELSCQSPLKSCLRIAIERVGTRLIVERHLDQYK